MAEKSPQFRPLHRARAQLHSVLLHALEEEITCSTTVRDCLGSLTGPNVQSLQRLFGEHARQIDCWLGEIVERTRAIGMAVVSGRRPRHSRPGDPDRSPSDRHILGEMVSLHEGIAGRLRQEADCAVADPATADLLARLVEFHETTAWMLRVVRDSREVPSPEW